MATFFRVCHINVARGYRGGERQTELLIRELVNRRVGQALVARQGEPLVQRLADLDLDIREVSGNPLVVAAASGGTDLLHVHEGRSVYSAYLRSLLVKTPYIITRRVNNPIGDHHWAHRAYRRAAYVAAVAPQVAEIVGAFDPEINVTVVHSGSSGFVVDEAKVDAIKRRFAGKYIVGHVGALDNAQKGQVYLIEAARALRRTHPDLHFLLVGGGDDEAMLRALAADLDNLTFEGFVENVGDYLAAMDLFVLPSNREGIGSILFDAMERHLPIIATRVGGVPDIVHDGENGILIEPARSDRLRDAIVAMCSDPARARELGARGAEVAKRYTASAMCDKYLELYRETLGWKAG